MLSRVADSLYWMSRYMERSDGMLRMVRVNYAYSQEQGIDFSWGPLLTMFAGSHTEEKIDVLRFQSRESLKHMVLDKGNNNSVLNIVAGARENARSVQDHVTKELWQSLNDFYHTMRDGHLQKLLETEDPVTVIDQLIKQVMHFYGSAEITMPRGQGFYFMNMGKFLERAQQSVDVLEAKFSELDYSLEAHADDPAYWKYLLMSVSGYEIFLKSYRSSLGPRNIVHQIIWNANFPRSILYSLTRLKQSFETIKTDREMEGYKTVSYMIGKLQSRIMYTDMKDLESQGVQTFLKNVKDDLIAIGNALNHYYFAIH